MKLPDSFFSRRSIQIQLLLGLVLILNGCASEDQGYRSKRRKEGQWYQSDMSTEEKSFFIGSFFNGH